MDFQHISGKIGQNFVDDFGSRNPVNCTDPDTCKVCNFVKDCAELVTAKISMQATSNSIIGQVLVNQVHSELVRDIITGTKPIPFQNRNAMKYLQDQDPILRRVKSLLMAGESPKPNDKTLVKRFLQRSFGVTMAKDGCLIVNKQGKHFVTRQLLVIPDTVSSGLLYSLHWNLNHPSAYQLMKAVDTKFFIL